MTFEEALMQLASAGTDPTIMSALRSLDKEFAELKLAYESLETKSTAEAAKHLTEMTNIQIAYQNVYNELKAYESNVYTGGSTQTREPTIEEFKGYLTGRIPLDKLKQNLIETK